MQDVPAVPGTTQLADAVDATFAEDGLLAAALEEYEPREGQRRMASAVSATLADGGVLLVEAGTGTGKTLAYLAPAILSRRRVLVSTGTKNLQEQIFFKDLPLLDKALQTPFTATYMKGRANYLCKHRFETFRATAALRPDERLYLRVLEDWAPRTETGDRAELEELPEDLPFWNDISATSDACLGASCPEYDACFVTQMRSRAAASDVVIVNHHLLCADASVRQSEYGQVIPDCHALVVDEAHQLEDVATQYFGRAVSTHRLDELARDGERATVEDLTAEEAAAIRRALSRLREHARGFFEDLVAALFAPPDHVDLYGGSVPSYPGRASASKAHGAPRSTAGGHDGDRRRVRAADLAVVADSGGGLLAALHALQTAISEAKTPSQDLELVGRRAAEIAADLAFVSCADDPAFVYYVETRRRAVVVRASPIDVSAIVQDLLFSRMQASILTSATLGVGGTFDYIRGRLGIAEARELRTPSEFDFANQAALYLPPDMPDPRTRDFAYAAGREVVQILRRTQGRAFVLFTSYATLKAVFAIVEREIDYPLLLQGTAPRSALVARFRRTPHAVLFATSSFWQGVDVVGEALSCVIIDKLPFASPADPVTSARIEAITARGGDSFHEYQIPLAILSLLQGMGRLLRHRHDRGVLAILDPRLQTMRYGQRFLASLPPAPITNRLSDIEEFFLR